MSDIDDPHSDADSADADGADERPELVLAENVPLAAMPAAIVTTLLQLEPHDTDDAQLDTLLRWFAAFARSQPTLADACEKVALQSGMVQAIKVSIEDPDKADAVGVLVEALCQFACEESVFTELLQPTTVMQRIRGAAVDERVLPPVRVACLKVLQTALRHSAGREWVFADDVLLPLVVKQNVLTTTQLTATAIAFLTEAWVVYPDRVRRALQADPHAIQFLGPIAAPTALFFLNLCSAVLAHDVLSQRHQLIETMFVTDGWGMACIKFLQSTDRIHVARAVEVIARLLSLPSWAVVLGVDARLPTWNATTGAVAAASIWPQNLVMMLLLSSVVDHIHTGFSVLQAMITASLQSNPEATFGMVDLLANATEALSSDLIAPVNNSAASAFCRHMLKRFATSKGDVERKRLLAAVLDAFPVSLNAADALSKARMSACMQLVCRHAGKSEKVLTTFALSMQRVPSIATLDGNIMTWLLNNVGHGSFSIRTTMILLQTISMLLAKDDLLAAQTYADTEWRLLFVSKCSRALMDTRWEVRDSALELIQQVAKHAKDLASAEARAAAANLLAPLIDAEDAALRDCIANPEPYVRASALRALATCAESGLLPVATLLELALTAATDSEAIVRRAAVETFGCAMMKQAVFAHVSKPMVHALLADPDSEVRASFMRVIVSVSQPASPQSKHWMDITNVYAAVANVAFDCSRSVREAVHQLYQVHPAQRPAETGEKRRRANNDDDEHDNDIAASDAVDDDNQLLKWSLRDLFAHQHIHDLVLDCY